jgi:DNA-binding transcriptional LysR family regulator
VDINGHDLPLLASLRTMLEEKNVTRAAARLGISQPALSAQLARLRDVFGDQLLTPSVSGKGMVLTPRGAALREPLRLAMQKLEDVVNMPPTFDPANSYRTFTIGANDNATAIVGSRLISRLQRNGASQIRLAFRSVDYAKLSSQLESGEIHVGLVSKRAVPNNMPNQALLEEQFMMAQRRDHPRGSKRPSLEEYIKLDHVIVSGDGGGFHGFVDDILAESQLTRRVALSVQHYSVVPLLLKSTDFVCTLPRQFLGCYADELLAMPLPFDTKPFTLHATWHARFEGDPAHRWLREQIQNCAD